MKISEIRLGSESNLFSGGGMLPRIDIEPNDPGLRRLDDRYALWDHRHIREIAHENEAIGEQFSDLETAGIIDTQNGDAVALIMWDDEESRTFPNSVTIKQIETSPRVRGQGFARYLYTLLRGRYTIVSDKIQTLKGAKIWAGMQRSGLPVQGYIQFGSGRTPEELDAEKSEFSYVNELKRIGARLINPGKRFPTYLFPVVEQNGRLDTQVKSPLNIYRSSYTNLWDAGLVVIKK